MNLEFTSGQEQNANNCLDPTGYFKYPVGYIITKLPQKFVHLTQSNGLVYTVVHVSYHEVKKFLPRS